jgi:hypothetical protein
VGPGSSRWYRFWYPGGAARISVITTFSSTQAIDPDRVKQTLYVGNTIDLATQNSGVSPLAPMVRRLVYMPQVDITGPYMKGQMKASYQFVPGGGPDWYLLLVTDDAAGVSVTYTGHISPVGAPPTEPTPEVPAPTSAARPATPTSARASSPPPPEATTPAPGACPFVTPRFVLGFATLDEQIGPTMGNPVECEHANPENGDTLQKTTTGLAFYRKNTNTPTFTNGTEHWALASEGVVYWTGDSIDPPADTQSLSLPDTTEAPPVAPGLAPAPAASAPGVPDWQIRAIFVASLQGVGSSCGTAEFELNDTLRRQRLGVLPPGYAEAIARSAPVAATTIRDFVQRLDPPSDLVHAHRLYLAAMDEYVTGAQAEAEGLPTADQRTLATAVAHFERCRALVAQADQEVG